MILKNSFFHLLENLSPPQSDPLTFSSGSYVIISSRKDMLEAVLCLPRLHKLERVPDIIAELFE